MFAELAAVGLLLLPAKHPKAGLSARESCFIRGGGAAGEGEEDVACGLEWPLGLRI